MNEKEQLFKDIKNRLIADGYSLEPIEGAEKQYNIINNGETVGEFLAGLDGNDIQSVYINTPGDFRDIASMSDYEDIAKAFPEPVTEENIGSVSTPSDPLDIASQQNLEEERERAESIENTLDDTVEMTDSEVEDIYNTTGDMDTLINGFTGLYPESFGVTPEEGSDKIKMLSAVQYRDFIVERGITAGSVSDLEQKIAMELSNDLYREMSEPVYGQDKIDAFRKEVDEINQKEEPTMEQERQGLNLDPETMSQKDMVKEIVNHINRGEAPTQEQQKWIDGAIDDKHRPSAEIKSELDALKDRRKTLLDDIKLDNDQISKLQRQINNQLSVMSMQGKDNDKIIDCHKKIERYADGIAEKTLHANEMRKELVDIEQKILDTKAQYRQALGLEGKEKVQGIFDKMHSTLKAGVNLGIRSLEKIRDGLEKTNLKVMNMKDTHEKVNAYKDLADQVSNINRDYSRKMEVVVNEYKLNMEHLSERIEAADRKAQIRGTLHDLGRLLVGKEAEHKYERSEKDQDEIDRIKGYVQKNKDNMEKLNTQYERTVTPKHEELKDFGERVEEKGRKTEDIFTQRLSRIHKENQNKADDMHKASKEILSKDDGAR
ncbi:MAG: hypothetical protein K6G10_04025 [Butyrivibrio sp.]|nr:hypothetical protein [Butyrivibrio sp.]